MDLLLDRHEAAERQKDYRAWVTAAAWTKKRMGDIFPSLRPENMPLSAPVGQSPELQLALFRQLFEDRIVDLTKQ